MLRPNYLRRVALLTPTAGLLLANGCMAALESGLDRVLAPAAAGNLLVAPYSPLFGVVQAIARLAQG